MSTPGSRGGGGEGEDLREEEAHCNPVLRIRTLRIQDGKAGKDGQTGGGTLSHTHAEVPEQVP